MGAKSLQTLALQAHRRRKVVMRFSAGQEQRLRSALRQKRSIFAETFGVLTDAQGDALKVTAGRQIRITS